MSNVWATDLKKIWTTSVREIKEIKEEKIKKEKNKIKSKHPHFDEKYLNPNLPEELAIAEALFLTEIHGDIEELHRDSFGYGEHLPSLTRQYSRLIINHIKEISYKDLFLFDKINPDNFLYYYRLLDSIGSASLYAVKHMEDVIQCTAGIYSKSEEGTNMGFYLFSNLEIEQNKIDTLRELAEKAFGKVEIKIYDSSRKFAYLNRRFGQDESC